ncbi:MAG: ATP-binding protein [Clostridia bacterium]|nr:ATP-binding protein [Clostridia bacterium]
MELILTVGIPACGKSTLSKKYKEEGYCVLSSDEIRAELQQKIDANELRLPDNTNLNAATFDQVKSRAIAALKVGRSVYVDATNLGRKRRINFLRGLYKFDCKLICMLFVVQPKICMERNTLRQGYARVPDEAMYNMFCSFECPNYWEGWHEIITVVDDTPYEFNFDWVKDLSQDNPHHRLTLGEHMQSAWQYAVDNGFSQAVQTTAKYHDIGKLYTKRFENIKGEKTEIAHYYGHENYGAYLYLVQNLCGKQVSVEDFNRILYETNLINCHMRPLNVWRRSDNAKRKDKERFGEQFFNDLVNLNICDKKAH